MGYYLASLSFPLAARHARIVFEGNEQKLVNIVASSYKPMQGQKLWQDVTRAKKKMTEQELKEHSRHRPDVGSSLTCDGVTKNKVPLVDFLVHVPDRQGGKTHQHYQLHRTLGRRRWKRCNARVMHCTNNHIVCTQVQVQVTTWAIN